MLASSNYESITDQKNSYLKARNSIGLVNNSHLSKILVQGEGSLKLINHFSGIKVDDMIANNFYTIFLKGKSYKFEVLVLRLSVYRYLVIGDSKSDIIKLLKSKKRKYRNVVISDYSSFYSLFSFHGNNSEVFFKEIDYRYLYKTLRQEYSYYQLLIPKKDEEKIFKHFSNLNFIPISIEVEKIFLYNNNVILNIEKIKRRYRLSVCAELFTLKRNFKYLLKIKIRKYELVGNYLVTNKHQIYNEFRKKAGIIHTCYQLPNKTSPIIISFILKKKNKKIGFLKFGKTEVMLKPIFNY